MRDDIWAKIGHLLTAAILLFAITFRALFLELEFQEFLTVLLLFLFLFLNLFTFALHHEPPLMRHLIPASLITVLAFWFISFINHFFASYSTDSIVMSHMGAELFLKGINPYGKPLLPYLERFSVPYPFVTPLMNASIVNVITYPALNFLIFVPFLALGVNDLRWALLFFHIAFLLMMYVFVPENYRCIVLPPLFIIPAFLDFTPGAVTDVVWVFFFILSLIFWRSENNYLSLFISGFFLGLAMSFKQIVWLAFPFLLIRLWYENKSQIFRKITFFCVVTALSFLMVNLPFIISSPDEWSSAVLAPLFPSDAPMAPYGFSISIINFFNIPLPKYIFTQLLLLSSFLSAMAYYLFFNRFRFGMWPLLMVIPLFWWRCLPNYLIYWLPLMIFDMTRSWEKKTSDKNPFPSLLHRNKKPIFVLLLSLSILFAFFSGLFALHFPESNTIEITDIDLIQEEGLNAINQMNVTVENVGEKTIIPKFAISWRCIASNLIYWSVSGGPDTLSPGESATYHISTDVPAWFLRNGTVFTLVVNDADNPNIIGTSQPITVEVEYSGKIVNGNFKYWVVDYVQGFKLPYEWLLLTRTSAGDDFSISQVTIEGKNALCFHAYQDGCKEDGTSFGKEVEEEPFVHTGLIQKIWNITKMNINVYPTFYSEKGVAEYGVRISRENHHLVILFSNTTEKKYSYNTYSNIQELTLFLPLELNQWNNYTINPLKEWAYLGWELPNELFVEVYIAIHYTRPGDYVVCFEKVSND